MKRFGQPRDQFRDYSLQEQTALAANLSSFIGISLAVVGIGGAALGIQQQNLREDTRTTINWLMRQNAAQLAQPLASLPAEGPRGERLIWLRGTSSVPRNITLQNTGTGTLPGTTPNLARLARGQMQWLTATDTNSGESYIGAAFLDPARVGTWGVVSLTPTNTQMWLQLQTILYGVLAVIVSMAAAVITGRAVSRTFQREISMLGEDCQAAAEGRQTTELEEQGSREIRQIRRQVNRLLSKRNEIEAQKDNFLSDVSHELRTPVTAIGGHAQFLIRRDPEPAQRRESLQAIDREARRMTQMLNELMDLIRGTNNLTLHAAPTRLAPLIEAALDTVSMTPAYSEGTALEQQGEASALIDEDRLSQVLINVTSNALNAGATAVDVRLWEEGAQACISVRDNGAGLETEHLERVFERFFRTDASRDRHTGGTGLGLAICRMLIQAQQGQIWIESAGTGQGSTVQIRLPQARTPANDAV